MAREGLAGFFDRHTQAKKGPRRARQVPVRIKRLIWELRVREHECCGQKIAYFLEREYHVRLSVPKIYEILAEKYVIRSKWRKNQKRGAVPKAACARAVIQMDTVAFGHIFAFTGIDIYTKETMLCSGPHCPVTKGPSLCKRPWAGALRGALRCCKPMGDQSSNEPLRNTLARIVTGIAWSVPTRRTSKPILNASFAHDARNA
jgi:hypothetical protein